MKLFLIRHLQTQYNSNGLLQGNLDIPILEPTEKVYQQINKNKQLLEQFMPFDNILVSSLQRTRMTAECYGFDKEIKVEKLLNELDFGSYEGKAKAELIADHGETWLNNPQQLVLGEPLTQLAQRIFEFLHQYQNKQVLIFGHGSWLRALHSISQHRNIDKMNQISIANNHLLQLTYNH